MLPDLYKLPYPRVSPQDKQSFAYTTLIKRWPTIVTGIINTVGNITHDLHASSTEEGAEKLAEGKKIIEKLSALKHEMTRNTPLPDIEDDGQGNVECYNQELSTFEGEKRGWSHVNWLFAECYLYRRLRTILSLTTQWRDFDPFFTSKADTYRSSSGAIIQLAKALHALTDRADLANDYEKPNSPLQISFMEMVQADLWGNATDLSLLVDLKYEDLQKLQAVGAAAQADRAKWILRNDLDKAWDHIKTVKNGRLDIVLDNAGFELYTDFILADFLLSCTPFVSKVVFHCKAIPWFVSDVLPYDFTWAIEALLDTDFFARASPPPSNADTEELGKLARRWKDHLSADRFRLSLPLDTPLGEGQKDEMGGFWTTQYAYQDMPVVAPKLLEDLQDSDLVVFKGDLNYRKMLGDAWWPPATSFDESLGPLAGKITLLSLRTNKADTIAGLAEGVAEKADKEDSQWRVSGKYAVVSFSPRSA